VSDEIEKLDKEIDAIRTRVDNAIKDGLITPVTAIGVTFELHYKTMKLQK